jgi:hypothetical protein
MRGHGTEHANGTILIDAANISAPKQCQFPIQLSKPAPARHHPGRKPGTSAQILCAIKRWANGSGKIATCLYELISIWKISNKSVPGMRKNTSK